MVKYFFTSDLLIVILLFVRSLFFVSFSFQFNRHSINSVFSHLLQCVSVDLSVVFACLFVASIGIRCGLC